ncbi:MAG: shikimate kinase [Peptococcaceae bacterium]|nr:shikimate kinase [Peptococcaceae bacterium]
MKNIVLAGFMGTGKTTVGRILAHRLGLRFIDTDEEIERVTGKTVSYIINRYGLIRFRSEESLLIKKLSLAEGLVIATGGGAVLDPDNVAALKKNGVVVLIRSSPEVVSRRVKSGRKRPLLAGADDLTRRIEELMAEREEAYSKSADLEVFSEVESREEVADKIIRLLRERKYI